MAPTINRGKIFMQAMSELGQRAAREQASTRPRRRLEPMPNDLSPYLGGGSGGGWTGGAGGGLGVLQAILNVVDTGRAAVSSFGKELQDEGAEVSGAGVIYSLAKLLGGEDINKMNERVPGETFSLGDWWDQTFDPEKRISGRDLLFGNEEKGVRGENVYRHSTMPSWAKSTLGFAADVAMDPLTYVGGAGIAKKGPQAVATRVVSAGAEEIAQVAERKGLEIASKEIAKDAAERGTKAAVEKILKEGTVDASGKLVLRNDATGKLIRAFGDDAEIKAILEATQKAAAKARRTRVSQLSEQEIDRFLTGANGKRLADRGLQFGVGTAKVSIPGTKSAPAKAFGELFARGQAGGSDLIAKALGGRIGSASRELLLEARSGDPQAAFNAIWKKIAQGEAEATYKAVARQFKTALRDAWDEFTPEDMKNLRPALEGDPAAIASFGGRGDRLEGVQRALKDMYDTQVASGANIRELQDYAPRQLTDQGRKLLDSISGKAGEFGPLATHERARTLVPDANGEYSFLGQKFTAANEAEVTAKVNEIAKAELTKLDPEAAQAMEGFFEPDIGKALFSYADAAARRIGERNAATTLFNTGSEDLGSLAFREVPNGKARQLANQLRPGMQTINDQVSQHADNLASIEAKQRDAVESLLQQRVAQLDASIAGRPLGEGLTDAQTMRVADAAVKDAAAGAKAATDVLDALEERAVQRAGQRGAAVNNLQAKIADLRGQLAAAKDADTIARLQDDVLSLATEHETWARRSQEVIAEALAGTREGVVMPQGWQTRMGEVNGTPQFVATPRGEWKVVAPDAAFRNAPRIYAAVGQNQANIDMVVSYLDNVVAAAKNPNAATSPTRNGAEVYDGLARIFEMSGMSAEEAKQAVDAELGGLLFDARSGSYVFDRNTAKQLERRLAPVAKALKAEQSRLLAEYESAVRYAEKLTVDGKSGLVHGPLYHASFGGVPAVWNDLADQSFEHLYFNLDGGALYTSTDQSGKVLVGRPFASEGYLVKEAAAENLMEGTPTVAAYGPRDPASVLLPMDRPIGWEDISPETEQFVDNFWGGGLPEFDAATGATVSGGSGIRAIDEIASHDPIAAAIVDDMASFLDERVGPLADSAGRLPPSRNAPPSLASQYGSWHEVLGHAYFTGEIDDKIVPGLHGAYQQLRRSIVEGLGWDTPEARDALVGYIDRLYDDLGVKGLTREGGVITQVGVKHDHMMWFRPNDDLELIGKSDFTAAFAEKKAREAARSLTRVTDLLHEPERLADELAAAESQLGKYGAEATRRPRIGDVVRDPNNPQGYAHIRGAFGASHGNPVMFIVEDATGVRHTLTEADVVRIPNVEEVAPGTLKAARTPKLQRAEDAARAAQAQHAQVELFRNETADDIAARIGASLDQQRRIRALLQSGAPLNNETKAIMNDVLAESAEAVKWGRVQQGALDGANAELAHVAALERAAADTSATLSDLHQTRTSLGKIIDRLDNETILKATEEINKGLQMQLRPGIGTPVEIADALRNIGRVDLGRFLKNVQKVTGWMAAWQIATPGFHTRNWLGIMFNNALADVSLSSYYEFFKVRRAVLRGEEASVAPHLLERYRTIEGIVGAGHSSVGTLGMAEEYTKRRGLDRLKGVNPFDVKQGLFTRRGSVVTASQHVGGSLEHTGRGVLAWDVMKKGGGKFDAMHSINKFHFNYSDLSAAEQKLRVFMPFYAWTRNNLPLQLEMVMRNPRVYSRTAQVQSAVQQMSEGNPNEAVPNWFGQLGPTMRLPWQREGGHVYLTPDLPMRDLEYLTPGGAFGVGTPLRKQVANLSPVVKTPVEMFANKQLYKDYPLSETNLQPLPLPPVLRDIVGPVMAKAGVAEQNGGQFYVSEKNAYLLNQWLPVLNQYNRLFPRDERGKDKQLTAFLSWIGIGLRTNTTDEQQRAQRSGMYAERSQVKGAQQRQRALEEAVRRYQGGG